MDTEARTKALEDELAERATRANEALAAAQDRTYWLDRVHLDLNSLMANPLAVRLLRLLPIAREVYRAGRRAAEARRRLGTWRRSADVEAVEDVARAQELAAGELGEVAVELLRRAGCPPGRDTRALYVGGASAPAWARTLLPGIETTPVGARFDLIVLDDGARLRDVGRLLAPDGRLLLNAGEPPETVLERTAFAWSVVARGRTSGAGDLYLLRPE